MGAEVTPQEKARATCSRIEPAQKLLKSALPKLHDGRVVEVFLGRALDEVVGFAGGGRGGQSNAQLIGEGQRPAQVLVHQAQRETRNVFALEQIWGFDIEYPGACHARLHDLDEFLSLDACPRWQPQ